MKHKFNLGNFSAKRRSLASKLEAAALPSPKQEPIYSPSELILSNLTPQQYKLYQKVYHDSVKTYKSKSESKHQPFICTPQIDNVISNHLKKKQQSNMFNKMYSSQISQRKSLNRHPLLVDTNIEIQKELLKKLSQNLEDLSSICQNSLLQYYHYRNLQKQKDLLVSKYIPKDINASIHRKLSKTKNKIDIKYLQGSFDAEKHQKLLKNRRETERVYAQHSEDTIQRAKLVSFIKNQKEVKQSVRLARRNISYKRALNQDRIKYLIACMSEIKGQNTPKTQTHKILKKIFFKFSNKQGNQKSRYKEITQQKFIELISKIGLNYTKSQAENIFQTTVSYKSSKFLEFQDFIAIMNKFARLVISTIQNGQSHLEKLLRLHILPNTDLYQEETYHIFNIYREKILRYLKKSKLSFCLETMFKSKDGNGQQQRKCFRDFYEIVEIFTLCNLVPPFESNKIHYFYSYLQKNDGIDIEEFKEMVVLIAMSEELGLRNAQGQGKVQLLNKGNDGEMIISGIDRFFERLNIYQKVLCNLIIPKEDFI